MDSVHFNMLPPSSRSTSFANCTTVQQPQNTLASTSIPMSPGIRNFCLIVTRNINMAYTTRTLHKKEMVPRTSETYHAHHLVCTFTSIKISTVYEMYTKHAIITKKLVNPQATGYVRILEASAAMANEYVHGKNVNRIVK